jgi:D-alanine-D-alanine ligase-like ATP-grasp enzyme
MLSRGIEVDIFDLPRELLEARLGDHYELFSDIDGSAGSYTASAVTSSKDITKRLLQRVGISVPKGRAFAAEQLDEMVAFADSLLGYPVVLKPGFGIQGEYVFTEIESADELRAAALVISNETTFEEVIVEEHFDAKEFRVFITAKGDYAVVYREPAHVIGDGISTITQLAHVESLRRMTPRVNCLCEIRLDREASQYLKRRAISFESVPAHGEKVYLRGSSNIKQGGVPVDVTDWVHPSVVEICLQAIKAIPGLPFAGVDFMCSDISQPPSGNSYRILELNSVPGIGIHIAPGIGRSRNVAAMIVDIIFPETACARREESWAA